MIIRRQTVVVLLFALLLINTPVKAAPERVVSLNYCYDQMLTYWLEPSQVLMSSAEVGRRIEQVFAFAPDLVLMNRFNNPNYQRVLSARGVTVEVLDEPSTLEGVLALWQRMSALLGEPKQARSDIQALQALLSSETEVSRGSYIAYQANQWAWGQGSLLSEVLQRMGFQNLAEEQQVLVRLTPEHIIALQPDWLLLEGSDGSFALAHISQWHAGLDQAWTTQIQLPVALTGCLAQRLPAMMRLLEEILSD